MLARAASRPAQSAAWPTSQLQPQQVCALSGKLPTSHCDHRITEQFIPGTAPTQSCDLHVQLPIDRRNGLRAGPRCAASQIEQKNFESYDARYLPWALASHRPVATSLWSPFCPGAESPDQTLSVRYPYPGELLMLDPSLPKAAQAIVMRANAPAAEANLRFVVDGKVQAPMGAPFEMVWPLQAGSHQVWVVPIVWAGASRLRLRFSEAGEDLHLLRCA